MPYLPFNPLGHLFPRRIDPEQGEGMIYVSGMVTVDADVLARFAAEGISPSVFEPFCMDLLSGCALCGKRPDVVITPDAVTCTGPCEYPDGLTTVIRLNVPSGKIIVSDSLRRVYDWTDADGVGDYNALIGQANATQVMAAKGCAYGAVGNSCPGLWRTGDDTYVIANLPYTEDDKEVVPDGWEMAAFIITDLWAYSIADFGDWTSKGGKLDDLGHGTVVNVTPGTYEFTCHTSELSFDRDADLVVFADIKRISTETGDKE